MLNEAVQILRELANELLPKWYGECDCYSVKEMRKVELKIDGNEFAPEQKIVVTGKVTAGEGKKAYLFSDDEVLAIEDVKAGETELAWELSSQKAGLHRLVLYVGGKADMEMYTIEEDSSLGVELAGPDRIEPGNTSIYRVKVSGEVHTVATVTFQMFTSQSRAVEISGDPADFEELEFEVAVPETEDTSVFAVAQVSTPAGDAQEFKEVEIYHKPPEKKEVLREEASTFLETFLDNLAYIIREIMRAIGR